MKSAERVVDEVMALLERAAAADYIGEAVSQQAHALQCAELAREAGADDELVLAALLHDIGHLVASPDVGQPGAPAETETMAGYGAVAHEVLGARYLAERGFSPRITALVAGHVEAKRYLTFKHADYRARLSPASQATLAQQGGPMTAPQARAFEHQAEFADLLRLRAWDDRGKRVGHAVAPLEAYRALLLAHLAR